MYKRQHTIRAGHAAASRVASGQFRRDLPAAPLGDRAAAWSRATIELVTILTEAETEFPLSESAASKRAAVLTLLGNPARLRLVTAMYLSPYSTVTQLSEDIGLSQNRVSSLLGSLRRARIVEYEMIGRSVHYRVSDEFARAVVAATLADD